MVLINFFTLFTNFACKFTTIISFYFHFNRKIALFPCKNVKTRRKPIQSTVYRSHEHQKHHLCVKKFSSLATKLSSYGTKTVIRGWDCTIRGLDCAIPTTDYRNQTTDWSLVRSLDWFEKKSWIVSEEEGKSFEGTGRTVISVVP